MRIAVAFLLIFFGVQGNALAAELGSGYWYDRVGSTPFNPNNALDIARFCAGGLENDSTNCARDWIEEAERVGAHLYASAGIYVLNASLDVFDGMHLRCESPSTVVFRKAAAIGPLLGNDSSLHLTDILIENCGFDMNGDPSNYADAIKLVDVQRVTVRGNRIFDNTGVECDRRDCQRHYVLILRATDILIEDNHFSEGGRIKAGRPGRRMVIRNNVLDFVNDNGITVVAYLGEGWSNGTNISEDILIYGNTIKRPTVTGILFGADGEPNGAGVTTRRVTIVNNKIEGPVANACINGVLPDHASNIFIADNVCYQSKPNYVWTHNMYIGGIKLGRTSNFSGAADKITMARNRVLTRKDFLDNAAFFVTNAEVCLLNNVVRGSSHAAWIHDDVTVLLDGNDWGGGKVRIDESSVSTKKLKCYKPSYLR